MSQEPSESSGLHAEVKALRARVRELEQALQLVGTTEASLARFRRLSHAAVEGLCIHDQGVILDANEAWGQLFGYEVPELVGQDGLRLFAPEYREDIRRRIRAESEESYEAVGLRKDGATFPIEVHAKHIAWPGGTARVAAVRDITDRKRAEAQQHEWEARERQIQKLEGLAALAGGVAHDFNNLLTVIMGQASLAQLHLEGDTPARTHIEAIQAAGERAAELTGQMLAYSGCGRFMLERLDLSDLVREMIATGTLDFRLPPHVGIVEELACRLPAIEADAAQLRRAVRNLCTNACEALGDRMGTLVLRTGSVDADRAYLDQTCLDEPLPEGRYVYLEVCDTGEGMDPAVQARIFEPFFSTRETGRGLGLAAVLGIMRVHHGTLKVDSHPGSGTCVRMLFPAAE